MHELITTITNFIGDLGYIGIFFMMVLESSFFPFPSEVAMVPAGYLSSIGQMNFAFAFMAGTSGAMVGATINYLIGWKLGAPLIKKIIAKYGKYIFLSPEHYDKTEYFFLDHGSLATFMGRLITGIRQIISLPAGVFKMQYGRFLLYTTAGAGLWNLVLMVIGYLAGENKELIAQYASIAFVGTFILVGVSTYTYFQRRKYPNYTKSASLILFNKKGEILVQDRRSTAKYGEKWGFFGGHLAYQEKPMDTIIRELKEGLDLDISETVEYLGKMQIKLPERHVIAHRRYFYDTTDIKNKDITVLKGDGAVFITIEELETLDGFIVTGKHLKKLISLIKKAQLIVKKHEQKK